MRFGLADPRFDAAGYRALMVLQLAERRYDDPYLFEDVLMGRFTTPVTVERRGATDVIEVPEILETSSGSNVVLRGASIQLVALLESGDLDCAFEYESVARQHGLDVRAPAGGHRPRRRAPPRRVPDRAGEAGLPPLRQRPARVHGGRDPLCVHDPGERAGTRAGASSSPRSCSGPDGRRILEADYQPLLTPPEVDDAAAAPEEVRRACAGTR